MPSVDISTTTINKQRIALSGRFCWRNQQTTKYQPMVIIPMETTWKADNLLDRIRISEPLEKRQNVGRAETKVHNTKRPKVQQQQRWPRLTKKPGTQTNRDLGQDSNTGTT